MTISKCSRLLTVVLLVVAWTVSSQSVRPVSASDSALPPGVGSPPSSDRESAQVFQREPASRADSVRGTSSPSDNDEDYFSQLEQILTNPGSPPPGFSVAPRELPGAEVWVPEGWSTAAYFPVDQVTSEGDTNAVALLLYSNVPQALVESVIYGAALTGAGWEQESMLPNSDLGSCYVLDGAGTANAVCFIVEGNALFMAQSSPSTASTDSALVNASGLAEFLVTATMNVELPAPESLDLPEGAMGSWSAPGTTTSNIPSDDDDLATTDDDYPAEIRSNFVTSCSQQAGATVENCTCMLEAIEAQTPIDEFISAELAISNGESIPSQFEEAMVEAIIRCAL